MILYVVWMTFLIFVIAICGTLAIAIFLARNDEDNNIPGWVPIPLAMTALFATWLIWTSIVSTTNSERITNQEICAAKQAEYYKIYRDYLCLTEDGRIVR
jgi:hypothetical protein